MLVMWNLTDVWMNKRRIWTTERNKQTFISCTRSTRVHLRMLQTANCLRSIKSQSGLAARQTCKSECFQCDRTHTTARQSVFRRLYATIVTMYCVYACEYVQRIMDVDIFVGTCAQRTRFRLCLTHNRNAHSLSNEIPSRPYILACMRKREKTM